MEQTVNSSDVSISDAIKDTFPKLSHAEKRVARSMLSDYPASCLGSVASIAERAGVSAPSVIRFTKSLGYESFVEFRDAVLTEMSERSKGPLDRARRMEETSSAGDRASKASERINILAAHASSDLDAIPQTEWDQVVALLADKKRTIYVAGGRFSTAVARILALNLQLLRPNVMLLDDLDQKDKGCLLDMNRRSVFIVFDFARYQKNIIRAAHVAKQKGATIVLISDGELSPIKTDASIVLPISTDSFLPLSGMATATAITEILLSDVYTQIGSSANEHLTEWELLTGGETVE